MDFHKKCHILRHAISKEKMMSLSTSELPAIKVKHIKLEYLVPHHRAIDTPHNNHCSL
jgi:hypothetical protein